LLPSCCCRSACWLCWPVPSVWRWAWAWRWPALSWPPDRLPVELLLGGLWQPALVALLFGVLTALAFSLPALARALSVSPAALFRGVEGLALHTPRRAWWLTAGVAALTLCLLVAVLPDPRFGLAFVVATAALLAVLDAATRGLRRLAASPTAHREAETAKAHRG